MNKWYFGIPLIALVVFAIFTFQYKKDYDAEHAKQVRIAEEQRLQRLAEERVDRLKAIEEATQNAQIRKEEAEERKKKEAAEQARREEERMALERAKTGQSSLRVEVKDVREELDREKRLLQAAVEKKEAHDAEREFLLAYVDTIKEQRQDFLGLVDRIEAAEKARAEAEAAAAAEASKRR